MINNTRLQIYKKAYWTRLNRGEKLEDIDKDYLNLKRLTQEDIDLIHKELKIN